MPGTLASFCRYLNGLTDQAPLAWILHELRELQVNCDELAEHVRFSSRGYTRNLVASGEWYNLLVLCWKNGQRSPIHDHRGSNCGVRVLRGTMSETLFEFAPNGHIRPTCSRDWPPNSVVGGQDLHVHQVSNLQASNADLVTLHVYSPPLLQMGTYSLTDLTRGCEPMLVEFSDAAGI